MPPPGHLACESILIPFLPCDSVYCVYGCVCDNMCAIMFCVLVCDNMYVVMFVFRMFVRKYASKYGSM